MALAGQTCKAVLEVRPAADEVEGYEAEDDDAEGEKDALGAVDVGDRAQASGSDVEEDDDRQQNRPSLDIANDAGFEGRVLDEPLEQDSGSPQLDSQVRHRKNHGDDYGENTHPVAAVIVAEHLPGGDVPVAFAEKPLPLEEDHAGERDRYRVEGGEGVGKSDAVDRAGMADEGPAAEGGGRGGEDENPQPDAAAG